MPITVKPTPGRRVRRPDDRYSVLPEEGAPVTWSTYYENALAQGDIEIVPDDPGEEE